MRRRWTEQGGFTLVELLVVILIIGILAAIAIPSFLGQESKAHDSDAISSISTAQKAIEIYRIEYGTVCGAGVPALTTIEPSLKQAATLAVDPCAGGNPSGYTLTIISDARPSTTFDLTLTGDGVEHRTCSPAGNGGCQSDGTW